MPGETSKPQSLGGGAQSQLETPRRCFRCVSWGTESCSEETPESVPSDWPGCEHYFEAEEAPAAISASAISATKEIPLHLWRRIVMGLREMECLPCDPDTDYTEAAVELVGILEDIECMGLDREVPR